MLDRLTQSKSFPTAFAALVLALALAGYLVSQASGPSALGYAVGSLLATVVGSLLFFFLWATGLPSGTAGASGSPHTLLALRELAEGRLPRRPVELTGADADAFDAIERLARKMATEEKEGEQLEDENEQLEEENERLKKELESIRGSRATSRPSAPRRSSVPRRSSRRSTRSARRARARRRPLAPPRTSSRARAGWCASAEERLTQYLDLLSNGFGEQMAAVEQTTRSMQEMTSRCARSRSTSRRSRRAPRSRARRILEMTATNDEVAENIGELASSVRETVSLDRGDDVLDQGGRQERRRALAHRRGDQLVDERDGRLDRPGAVERERDGAPLRGGRDRTPRRAPRPSSRRSARSTASRSRARRRWPSSRTSARASRPSARSSTSSTTSPSRPTCSR